MEIHEPNFTTDSLKEEVKMKALIEYINATAIIINRLGERIDTLEKERKNNS